MTSLGKIHIGMSIGALERALGGKLPAPGDEDEKTCRYVSPTEHYDGVSLMLIDDRVARIDIGNPKILTISGAKVGDSQDDVLAIYGARMRVSPHAYTSPDGTYLTMFSRDKRYGIRFETDHGKVSQYYVGTAEAVQYVEGCA